MLPCRRACVLPKAPVPDALSAKLAKTLPLMFVRIRRMPGALLAMVRVTPFDISTEAGRSSERYRRVSLSAISNAIGRFTSILSAIVSVPIALHYLGSERYGVWMTISSIVTAMAFADLGLGNGLMNAVSEANGKRDRQLARNYVSSAFFMLLVIAVGLGVVFWASYGVIPWRRVFGLPSNAGVREASLATAVFIGCFLVNIPAGIVLRVRSGYQEGYVAGLWSAAGSIAGLLGLLLAIKLKAGLAWLTLALTGAPVLALLIQGAIMFGGPYRWLVPSLSEFTFSTSQGLLRRGLLFFFLQLAVTVGFNSDNIVIAQVLGPGAVTQYAVPARLFALVGTVVALACQPLWPAYSEAIARGDIAWVCRTLRSSILITCAVTIPSSALLVVFGPAVLHRWTGPAVNPSLMLLCGLGLWAILSGLGNTLAMFLNAGNSIGYQAIMAAIMAAANLVISIFLTRRIGVPGVVYGSILAYSAILIPLIFLIRRTLLSMNPVKAHSGVPA